jgi:hypothetical protein
MKLKQYPLRKIPLTPREKRRKLLSIGIPLCVLVLLLGFLGASGHLKALLVHPDHSTAQNEEQQTAVIAETGVRLFTSIPLEGEYSSWLEAICAISTEQHAKLVRGVLGPLAWQNVQDSQVGVVNLSTRALRRLYASEPATSGNQFWLVEYTLASSSGENTYSSVVSVVQEEGQWKFNGFSLIPVEKAEAVSFPPTSSPQAEV